MNSPFRNWSDIRVFLAVMRNGSTLAAARSLGMAQPTVARRIDALEHELGLTLFDRDTRGFHPNEAARALLRDAENMEAAASDLEAHVQGLTAKQPVRITAFPANFSPRMMEILSDFSSRHPDIELEMLPGVKTLDLSAGEADIALRLVRSPVDDSLICRKISTAEFALFAAQSYVERHGIPASLDDLAPHRFVSFRRDDITNWFDDWLRARVPADRIKNTYTEIELMQAAIVAGHGIGFVNIRLAQSLPDLVQCTGPVRELESRHMILTAAQAHRRPEVRTFLKFFTPRYAELYR